MSDEQHVHEPHIKVLKGEPTERSWPRWWRCSPAPRAVPARAGEAEQRNLWGHPVDKLRYAIFSWQRVTLLERTHMRR